MSCPNFLCSLNSSIQLKAQTLLPFLPQLSAIILGAYFMPPCPQTLMHATTLQSCLCFGISHISPTCELYMQLY